jgi:glycogen debranching enzyme GlgX
MAGIRGEDAAGAGLCMLPAGSVTAPALRGLSRFADSRRIPASWEFLLDYDVIEAFCVAGLAGRAPATRGTYRSALYRLAVIANGPPGQRPTPFPGAKGIIAQDPVLCQVKLIAEPWDVGQPDSYSVGRFPAGWSEWNGRYRDTVRDFWRGSNGVLPDFATRIAGSSDLYGPARRRPSASINFITAHDGFTLRDLVSYNRKHNQANAEGNRDGTSDNRSWNCGAEGPAGNPRILALRARQSRALLATLLLSRGVPMILGGDELGRTQDGNNNAYCQDNPVSWVDWDAADAGLTAYTRRLIAVRRAHPVLHRDRYLADPGYVVWYTPKGHPMTVPHWEFPGMKAVAAYVDGTVAPDLDAHGQPMLDDDALILVNGSPRPVTFTNRPGRQAMRLAHRTGQLRSRHRRHGPHGHAGRPG